MTTIKLLGREFTKEDKFVQDGVLETYVYRNGPIEAEAHVFTQGHMGLEILVEPYGVLTVNRPGDGRLEDDFMAMIAVLNDLPARSKRTGNPAVDHYPLDFVNYGMTDGLANMVDRCASDSEWLARYRERFAGRTVALKDGGLICAGDTPDECAKQLRALTRHWKPGTMPVAMYAAMYVL